MLIKISLFVLICIIQQLYMAAGESDGEGVSRNGSSVNGSLSLAEPVACAGSSSPLLCSDAIPRDGNQQPEQVCVVCHYFPLSRALLPCKYLLYIHILLNIIINLNVSSLRTFSTGRHTCVCAVCFCKYLRTVKLSTQQTQLFFAKRVNFHEFNNLKSSTFWNIKLVFVFL
jgi:hypothetical protein